MKTRIIQSKGCIELIINQSHRLDIEKQVVAGMSLIEGSGLWVLADIRLSKYRVPSRYGASIMADDLCASYRPESPAESIYVKSLLREYREQPDGEILWCSFNGIVRGVCDKYVNGLKFNSSGYFSKEDALEKLHEIKSSWNDVADIKSNWRIENPHYQSTQSDVFFKVAVRRAELRKPSVKYEIDFDNYSLKRSWTNATP